MVELFAARFRETPGASPPDSPLSPRKKLPTPAEVRQSRLREICLPWVDYAMRCMASPTLNTDGLRQNSIASVSASPPFGAKKEKSYRIEFQDYSVLWELHYHSSSVRQDYSGKLPSSTDKHVSAHPAPPASDHTFFRDGVVTSRTLSHGWRPYSSGDRFQTDGI